MDKLMNNVKSWTSRKDSVSDISKSQYSLVSCGEVSPAALELWQGLPEEVKYDPALAAFRKLYEKQNDNDPPTRQRNGPPRTKRLPLVASAPHLNNNLQTVEEEDVFNKNNNNEGVGIEFPAWKKGEELEDQISGQQTKRQTLISKASHYTKLTLLLACWGFFTVIFLLYNEKEEAIFRTTVGPSEIKDYNLSLSSLDPNFLISMTGPFLSKQDEGKLNDSQADERFKFDVWLERVTNETVNGEGVNEQTNIWTLLLEENIDFSQGETLKSVLSFINTTQEMASYILRMKSYAEKSVPVNFSIKVNPLDITTGVVYSCILLCGLYVLIIFEIINRTMAAVITSTTSLAVLAMVGERPSIEELVSWLDIETLLLLFSMMLLVAIMAETGMFDFLAVFTFQVTRGKMWPLINLLSAITAVLSTFLDNVTTVLLMAPVTIRLCEVTELDPIPILMSMVLYSNIGGTATPVGDPPNVIVASNKHVIASGINFSNFTLHMTMGIVLVAIQTYFQMKWMFRDTSKLRMKVPSDILELRQQITVWRRASDSLPHLNKEEIIVRERLEKKIKKLNTLLQEKIKERGKRACPKDTFHQTLRELKEKYKIRDKVLLIKATVAITFVVIVFFLHSIPEFNRVSLGWTALLGAILLLILADREDLEPILHRVEWSTLLFFASLFVLMEALSKLGLIEFIGGLTERLILSVDESGRLAVALILILWVSGVSSAFVDNIPLTTMMVRIVTSLGNNPHLGLPLAPMIWALCFGGCLGGNGTLIGASANVVCAGVAEQHGYKFTFVQFFKVGFPIMIGHLIVASFYLLLCHCVFTWH